MNDQLATMFERWAARAPAQRLLRGMGLDPIQFVLFMGLFRKLSQREEFAGMAGSNRMSLAYLALFAAALPAVPVTLAAGSIPAPLYLLGSLLITFVLVFLTILREAANALFNPVESSMLAYKPVHSATYAAAKIAHVMLSVMYLVSGLILYPALIGVANPGARWFWPLTHLGSAYLIGFWTAFMISALYGLLVRWFPPRLLKRVALSLQISSILALAAILIAFPAALPRVLAGRFENTEWTWLPLAWFAELGLMGCIGASWRLAWPGALSIVVSVLVIWFGLRSFSGNFFAEGNAMIEGRPGRLHGKRMVSRWVDRAIRQATGAPLGLGAFRFVSAMMKRDWQFRRLILTQTWIPGLLLLLVILAVLRFGVPRSPFSGADPGFIHVLPHFLALVTMAVCSNLTFSEHHRGAYIYLLVPFSGLRPFARGVYWALWLPFAAAPHAALFLLLLRFWDWREAAIGTGFSLIALSCYLAVQLGLVSGLPFSTPIDESQTVVRMIYFQVCWLMATSFPIALNWALFRTEGLALASAAIVGIATWIALRVNLGNMENEIRWRLHLRKMGAHLMFREIR